MKNLDQIANDFCKVVDDFVLAFHDPVRMRMLGSRFTHILKRHKFTVREFIQKLVLEGRLVEYTTNEGTTLIYPGWLKPVLDTDTTGLEIKLFYDAYWRAHLGSIELTKNRLRKLEGYEYPKERVSAFIYEYRDKLKAGMEVASKSTAKTESSNSTNS